jgi:F0F1-type ATP synthase delta subunit
MTTISNNDIARAIYLVAKDKGKEPGVLKEIVSFLSRKRLLTKSPEILARLEKIVNEENGVVVVKVSSKI